MKKHALGIVVKDRWDLTHKTLQSLYYSDQLKDSYDLFLIDNGSDASTSSDLTQWAQSNLVPVKNLVRANAMPIGPAWNLFLSMTKDYAFRTKLDNDVIFANTPVAEKPFEREGRGMPHKASPGDAGSNPGAVPVAGFVVGGGHRIEKKQERNHTCFLQHVEEAISLSGLGVCAIPPVDVGKTLAATMPNLGSHTWRGHQVLFGACMTITKEAFNTLGYFDEQLPCHIDWEYAQRAMAHGINIGYTPEYCVIHFGKGSPTLPPDVVQNNEIAAKVLGQKLELKRRVASKWEGVSNKVTSAAQRSVIVNLR